MHVKMSAVQPLNWLLELAFSKKEEKMIITQTADESVRVGMTCQSGKALGFIFSLFVQVKLSEYACYFVLEFPQAVNNSHQQPLSHSPTYLTSIQCSDSHHRIQYFPFPNQENVLQKTTLFLCKVVTECVCHSVTTSFF